MKIIPLRKISKRSLSIMTNKQVLQKTNTNGGQDQAGGVSKEIAALRKEFLQMKQMMMAINRDP